MSLLYMAKRNDGGKLRLLLTWPENGRAPWMTQSGSVSSLGPHKWKREAEKSTTEIEA